ncbi:hypothetical protein HDA40_006887 [Hamadaea flava]|nr:hypothetical protein [Hamadaea flava]
MAFSRYRNAIVERVLTNQDRPVARTTRRGRPKVKAAEKTE